MLDGAERRGKKGKRDEMWRRRRGRKVELTEKDARLFGREAETSFRDGNFDSLHDEEERVSYLSICFSRAEKDELTGLKATVRRTETKWRTSFRVATKSCDERSRPREC